MNPGMGGASGPIEAVLFDLHSTVLDQGPSAQWLAAAAQLLPAGHCALDARAAGSRRPSCAIRIDSPPWNSALMSACC